MNWHFLRFFIHVFKTFVLTTNFSSVKNKFILQEFPRICEPVFERTYPAIVGLLISQSLQGARLFLQSSEMGPQVGKILPSPHFN